MQRYNVQPKKALGQNFLINPEAVQKIMQHLETLSFSNLVEIGPGWGALTQELKTLSDQLILIELDKVMAHHWQQQGFCVWQHDVLKSKWHELPQNTCVVSNLPYQVASRVLVDISCKAPQVQSMVLMFQKEVAQNIMAHPGRVDAKQSTAKSVRARSSTGDYTLLSVVAQHIWQVSNLFSLGCGDFYPRPKVASRVLSFKRKVGAAQGTVLSIEYLNFLKQTFGQRRKQLLNTLLQAVPSCWDASTRGQGQARKARQPLRKPENIKAYILKKLKALDIDPHCRAETLPPQMLWQLFTACCPSSHSRHTEQGPFQK